MFLNGNTGRAIAELLNSESVPTPNEYYYKSINKPNPFASHKNKWSSNTVMSIIKNHVYYGAIVNGKRVVKSFKNKTVKAKPVDEWVIVENMHTPLIDKERWSEAQKIIAKNNHTGVRRRSDGEVNLFSGLIKCADCGGNMVFERKPYKSYTKEFFKCSTYTNKGKNVCEPHYINFDIIYKAVVADIRKYAVLAVEDEKKLIDRILESNNVFKEKNLKRYEKTIRESKHRIDEIDGLIQAVLEEKINDNITDMILKRMTVKYEAEQQKLIEDLEQLEQEYSECKSNEKDITSWIKKIKACLSVETLTRDIALELIERIEVSKMHEVDGEQQLDINIVYKFGYLNILDNVAC